MRRSPLQRRTPLRAKPKPAKRPRLTGPARDVVDAVCERGLWSCEVCGSAVWPQRGVDYHIHHRRPRAMGGTDRADTNSPANLLLLCPACHDRIESHRTDAYRCGLLLTQTSDPTRVAVRLAGPRWVYLTADGRYSDNPPKEKK